MSETLGSNGNDLTITIPVAGETDWATSIRNSCFQAISDHKHEASGDGAKIRGYLGISWTDALYPNNTNILARNNAGTGTVTLLKVNTSDQVVYQEAAHLFDDDVFSVVDEGDATKKLVFSLGGATTAKTVTLVSSHTDNRTITLPDSTGTLLTASSPVLTTPQINDTSADHQYVFAVNELAADRTVTLPLLTGNDEFVFKDHAVTLTNKTLTAPTLNTSVSGTAVLDEDDMVSNSATQIATQQSIKAYVDSGTVTFTNKTFDADGTGNSLTNVDNANIKAAAAIALNKLAATTASRALVSDGSGFVSASAVTATELGYVSGVTSAIQTQLNAKASLSGATFTGNVSINNAQELRLYETGSTNYTAFKAPASLTGDTTFTLPDGDGAGGQVLKTDGAGTLSWTSAAGKVGQVVQTVKTDSYSIASTTYADITGFSVSITPSSASSKVLVIVTIGALSADTAGRSPSVKLLRGSTVITSNSDGGLADTDDAFVTAGGGGMSNNDRKIQPASIMYLDSPATTSATTYKCQMKSDSTDTVYFNRWGLNTDAAAVSTITVMEILP